MPDNTPKTPIILLAAGESARMGQPKQLIRHHGQTLLAIALQNAAAAGVGPVIVVLGAYACRIVEDTNLDLQQFVINEHWNNGMGSSIKCGLTAAMKHVEPNQGINGVIIMSCDQPLITPDVLRQLSESSHPLAACAYGNGVGIPAFFGVSFFPQLQSLPDRAGAKGILTQHLTVLHQVPFPPAALDYDTSSDLERLP